MGNCAIGLLQTPKIKIIEIRHHLTRRINVNRRDVRLPNNIDRK